MQTLQLTKDMNYNDLKVLEQYKDLRNIIIKNQKITVFDGLESQSQTLFHLWLDSCYFLKSFQSMSKFYFPHLETIRLDKCKNFSDLSGLQSIQLSIVNIIMDNTLISSLKPISSLHFVKLQEIQLYNCQLLKSLDGLESCKFSLKSLILNNCAIETLDVFSKSQFCLTDLRIIKSNLSSLDGVQHLFQLNILEIRESKICQLQQLQYMIHLKQLYLDQNLICCSDEFYYLQNLVTLKQLTLNRNPFYRDDQFYEKLISAVNERIEEISIDEQIDPKKLRKQRKFNHNFVRFSLLDKKKDVQKTQHDLISTLDYRLLRIESKHNKLLKTAKLVTKCVNIINTVAIKAHE
ncbi:Leucine-rich_repeat domain containing protein [Hexamita inflata]|uniref:Leucine-rich repeat domain containing protein n=1 Tax=Hexamita inflata TaxID=28002 RepID=A0AA86PFX9_9EUKA|nr:Leucine-rich repeat domain containing protein [Hexamita inflata]